MDIDIEEILLGEICNASEEDLEWNPYQCLPFSSEEMDKIINNINYMSDCQFSVTGDLDQPRDCYAVPFTENQVPSCLSSSISSEDLRRLAQSVLQICCQYPGTVCKLSPTFGVTTLMKMIHIAHNGMSYFGTAVSPVPKDYAGLHPMFKQSLSFDHFYNYQMLMERAWKYKELDMYDITEAHSNQRNDLAFVQFCPLPDSEECIDEQLFFVPSARTWDLHDTDVVIFAYPSSVGAYCPILAEIFPLDAKVIKKGKIMLKSDQFASKNTIYPPIVGSHSCGALTGMEGGAIVSVLKPDELLGIHKAANYVVTVHHPHFVQYYIEQILPDLKRNANKFFMRNYDRIDAYLRVHGYSITEWSNGIPFKVPIFN